MGKYFGYFVGLYIILKIVPLIINIVLSFLFVKKIFRDGNFNDLYENWNKKPIMGISIEDSFQGEKIIFGKTPDNTNVFKWKGSSFKVKRGEYNYFDSFSKKKDKIFVGLIQMEINYILMNVLLIILNFPLKKNLFYQGKIMIFKQLF